MMWTIKALLLASIAIKLHAGFDMWEIIEKNNKKFLEEVEGQRDDTGERIIGGDIYLKVQEYDANKKVMKKQDLQIQSSPRVQNLQPIFDYHRKLWKRRIPYVITNSVRKDTNVIKSSLRKIEEASCLSFFEVNYGGGGHRHWIEFYSAQGCFSGIGRRYWTKSATKISLGPYCAAESIIVHEVLHALGFYHEQSRMDRDSYVNVFMWKVNKAMAKNFDKNKPFDTDYAGTPYDIKSIMQYGNTAFRKSVGAGDTMQSKDDPGANLGSPVLSKLDILELNRRYQCPHEDNGRKISGVMSGWSSWSDWSKCGSNWRGDCSKARYRRCVDSDNCPGGNEYGAQEDVVACSASECQADKNGVDGIWGAWGEFGPCDSKCDWGMHTRTRQCNNPAPRGKGKKCEGFGIERKLCRKQRCGGPKSYDTDFERGYGSWKVENFQRSQGKQRVSGSNYGPDGDYTTKNERRGGYYATARKFDDARTVVASLKTNSLPSMKAGCLSFQYLLNGRKLHVDEALSVYLENRNGQNIKTIFKIGGHQSKDWQRAIIDLGNVEANTKVVIKAQFQQYKPSIVAIDDIFFDYHIACPKDLKGCKDTISGCSEHAKKGRCSTYWKILLRECCQTCQDPRYKIDTRSRSCLDKFKWVDKCKGWAEKGECSKNKAWMERNCCDSCKNFKPIKSKPTTAPCSDKNTKCKRWAEERECIKNEKWMKSNCCYSCKTVKPKPAASAAKCIDTRSECEKWAGYGECRRNKKWMGRNCCDSCKKHAIKCKDNSKHKSSCPRWAKNGECAKNHWMKANCCDSCEKHCVNKLSSARCDKYAKDKEANYCKKNSVVIKNCCLSCYKMHK